MVSASENNIIKDFYSHPQHGAGFAVYSGTRRQVGGSFLSGLARVALPILKFFAPKALNVVKNVASDVILDKKPLGASIKNRGMQEVSNTIGRVVKRPARYINKTPKRRKKDIFTK